MNIAHHKNPPSQIPGIPPDCKQLCLLLLEKCRGSPGKLHIRLAFAGYIEVLAKLLNRTNMHPGFYHDGFGHHIARLAFLPLLSVPSRLH